MKQFLFSTRTNTFDVDDLSALVHFSQTIPPQRLAAIRHLHVNGYCNIPPLEVPCTNDPSRAPYDDATYLQLWHTVDTKMPALTELRMILTDPWWVRGLTTDDGWVRPLKAVQGLKRFEFEIGPQRPGVGDIDRAQADEFSQKLRDSMCRPKPDTSYVEMRRAIRAESTVVGNWNSPNQNHCRALGWVFFTLFDVSFLAILLNARDAEH